MNETDKINFDFVKEIKEPGVYQLLFPKKEVGLAVMVLFEKIENKSLPDGKFIEKDLHDAFAQISKPNERYPKEIYSAHIEELQEYFLDYNQETQKYYFKDYAYRFYTYAKETLEGNFSPTHIEKICSLLTASLRQRETIEDLKFWLTSEFRKYEPDLREQVDFLDRQIIESVNKLKNNPTNSDKKFIDLLKEVENNLDKAQEQSRELASAYSETKIIRSILEKREDTDSETDDLIAEVHFFIKYLNERLDSIDRKLDRIQPKIRQLFAILNLEQEVPISQISTGQRSALALSIFLALNKKLAKGPNLIIFDDPVTYTDDLNILSFLDYLRSMVINESRQLIFATASNKIARLFEKKFDFLKSDFQKFELSRSIT